jgi:hypothetical protein
VGTIEFQVSGTVKFLKDEPTGYALVTLRYDHFTITARGDIMAYKLPNDKTIAVAVAYIDARGNAAEVDGDCTWDTSDAGIATVETDAGDSTHAKVIPTGPAGQVQVTVTADADLGEGVREIVTTMDIDIVAGEAVAGTISPVGEPQPLK